MTSGLATSGLATILYIIRMSRHFGGRTYAHTTSAFAARIGLSSPEQAVTTLRALSCSRLATALRKIVHQGCDRTSSSTTASHVGSVWTAIALGRTAQRHSRTGAPERTDLSLSPRTANVRVVLQAARRKTTLTGHLSGQWLVGSKCRPGPIRRRLARCSVALRFALWELVGLNFTEVQRLTK